MRDYEVLCQIISQWNANRLDLFALTLPNEVGRNPLYLILTSGLGGAPWIRDFTALSQGLNWTPSLESLESGAWFALHPR